MVEFWEQDYFPYITAQRRPSTANGYKNMWSQYLKDRMGAPVLHASTALRPEESLGLKWSDVNWKKGQIHIRRGWSKSKETNGKNPGSMTQVVMHPVLAMCLRDWRKESLYFRDSDWVFPSIKAKGRIPRTASICAQDYLRPAAVKAGVIRERYKGRFGWHNLRHSLASFFRANEVHPAVTQSILRHKKLSTTMEIYTHGVNSVQVAAQEKYLKAIGLTSPSEPENASAAETTGARSQSQSDRGVLGSYKW